MKPKSCRLGGICLLAIFLILLFSQTVVTAADNSGTFGNCSWSVSGGTLTIQPKSGSSCTLGSTQYAEEKASRKFAPWAFRTDVTRIVLKNSVKANSESWGLFGGLSKLTDITGLSSLDVSAVSNMGSFFSNCPSLRDVSALKSWQTGSASTMWCMFEGCTALSNLAGLSSWNVSNVTDMRGMFIGCEALTNLSALRSWQTGSATDMQYMFASCASLTNLAGLSSWDVSHVTNMNGMFAECAMTNLTGLGSWNVSSVTQMDEMFHMTKSLKDVSAIKSWNVSKVTNFHWMFLGTKVQKSSLSGWKISGTANTENMFPTPVSGLKASVSGESVKLTWSAFKGAKNYDVYRSTSSTSGFKKIGTASSTSYKDSGVSAGKTYYYKIQAQLVNNSDGYSGELTSEFSSVLKVAVPKIQVTGVSAAVSGKTVKLKWSKLSGAKTYYIYRSTKKSSDFKKIGTASSTSYSDKGLSYGKTYYYEVRAKLTTGKYSEYSTVLKVKVPNPQVTGLKATISGKTVKLSWSKLSGAKSYAIYRSTKKSSGFKKISTGSSASYTDKSLSYGKTYYFKVLGKLSSGDTCDYSSVLTVAIPVPQVKGLKSSLSGTTAKLSWSKLTDAKTYYIYRSTKKTSGFEKIGTASSTSYSAKSLSQGGTYYFKVRAKLTTGEYSEYSSVVTAAVPALSISGFKATVSGTTAKLSWTKLSGAKSYEIYRSTSASTGFTKIKSVSSNAYSDAGLAKATTYYFKIRALLTTGYYSNYTSAVKAAIPADGTFGSCSWYVTNGTLTIQPTSGSSCTLASAKDGGPYAPWVNRSDVKSIAIKGTVKAGSGAHGLFAGLSNLTNISGLSQLDVSGVTNMKAMFADCSSLTTLNGLQSWNVSKVSDLSFLFENCGSLTNLSALSSWNTSGAAEMYGVFMSCGSLTDLTPLSSWRFASGANLSALFADCSSLSNLSPLASWDVSNVSDISWMFKTCRLLTDVTPLGSWVVSNVTDMRSMFMQCSALEDVSALQSWNVSKVTEFHWMFIETKVSADALSGWQYSGSANRENMFPAPVAISALNIISGPKVSIEWEAFTAAENYEIWRSATSTSSGFTQKSTVSGLSYTDQDVAVGKTYYYKVRAKLADDSGYPDNIYSDFSSVYTAAVTADPSGAAQSASTAAEIIEECSEDGSTCTISEKVCTETECTITSKVCVVVGGQKACAEPVVTVVPVLTETPAVEMTPTAAVTATEVPVTETPVAEEKAAEVTEECSEDGSTCTVYEKVCTQTECTITSKVCVVIGDQKACAEPMVTVVPVMTETPAMTEETPTAEPAATEESPAEPAVTEEIPAEPVATEEAPAEPAVTEEVPEEPAVTEEIPAEPVATEEVPEKPAVTEEAPAEPAVTEEAPAEPTVTEEAPAEPAVTEEIPAEPAVTEEIPAEPAATEEAPAEPTVTEEAPAEPVVAEEIPAEPAVTEEAPAEPTATEEVPTEPVAAEEIPAEEETVSVDAAPVEDLTIREISIEDLTEDTIAFSAPESYTIAPEKLKVVPEAADWAELTFKLDDESIASFKSTDIEVIKAEGLTLNGLQAGTTTLRIQAGEVEKAVTIVLLPAEAETSAQAASE